MLYTELSSQQQGQHRGMNGGVISSCCSKDLADVANDASLEACGDVPGVQQDAERTSTGTAAAAWRRNSSSKPSAGGDGGRPAVADAADGTVDGVEGQAGTAGSPGPQSPGWPVLGRARKQVFVQLGELEAQLGVGEGKVSELANMQYEHASKHLASTVDSQHSTGSFPWAVCACVHGH